jgi:hypothetical protein
LQSSGDDASDNRSTTMSVGLQLGNTRGRAIGWYAGEESSGGLRIEQDRSSWPIDFATQDVRKDEIFRQKGGSYALPSQS